MYDRYDERGVPISSGIPPIIFISAAIGLVLIATMVTLVFANSGAGHFWPSNTSTTLPLD
jgi:ABC-type phosphate transport system auxiliary subunit